MKWTLGIFLMIIGLILLFSEMGAATTGETQTKSVEIPYSGDALQEVPLEQGWTFTTTIVDTNQPLDLRVFNSMGEVEKWRNEELAEQEVLGENVVSGKFDFTATEERLYYMMIEVSPDGEGNAYVQYKWGIDIPDADSDNDGVIDSEDEFPYDPKETKDTDGDGVGDNADAFPNDSSKWEIESDSENSSFIDIMLIAVLLGSVFLLKKRTR